MFTTMTEQLDDILDLTCGELQLPPSWHDAAEEHYHAICAWLEALGSELRLFRPIMYPQGSFRIGTTVRPIGRDEYDLDLVCELALDYRQNEPRVILELVERRLRENGTYRPMVKRLKRCIRLTYAEQFHLDVLPACPEIPPAGTRLRVPDRELRLWMPSNPKGYALWFETRSGLYLAALKRMAEPVPEQQTAMEKTPLQRAVQLLKRWRDITYRNDADRAPRSIVLTTLAGQVYAGELSTSAALTAMIEGILRLTASRIEPLDVRNPTNGEELLSEKWREDPADYRLFVQNLRVFKQQWDEALTTSGPALAAILEELFGDETRRAFKRQAERVNAARSSGTLRTAIGSGLLTTGASRSIQVRPNTFYGDVSADS